MSLFTYIWGGYALVAVLSWRPVWIFMNDTEDWSWGFLVFAIVVVSILAVVWPLTLVIGLASRSDPATIASRLGESRERRIKRLEARNRELEKEALR